MNNPVHWHEKEYVCILQIDINETLKSAAINTSEDFGTTLRAKIINLSDEQKSSIRRYDSLRDYFNRLRNTSRFNIDINTSSLSESQKYTLNHKKFLQFESDISCKNGYLIFATDENLNNLKKCKTWLADGTFYSSPKSFSQLFIIYGYFFNKTLPFIYILMKSKTGSSYIEIFKKIKFLLKQSPENFIIDFEMGIYNAINTIFFYNTKLYGCNFHFNQIFIRFLNDQKIIDFYKEDKNFKMYVKYLLLLAFVPPDKIQEEFQKILMLKQNNHCYNLITNFFKNNFLYSKIKNKTIEFWSVYERLIAGIPTTNNSCEAYHRHLNSMTSRKNSILPKVIELLKVEESRVSMKINDLKSWKLN
ncbi:hypothetical protein DMUE_0324 [Dictyocoela muelleri]|nr:hypothetical protein DMUE_0324 [Dictyocoela muelleri]